MLDANTVFLQVGESEVLAVKPHDREGPERRPARSKSGPQRRQKQVWSNELGTRSRRVLRRRQSQGLRLRKGQNSRVEVTSRATSTASESGRETVTQTRKREQHVQSRRDKQVPSDLTCFSRRWRVFRTNGQRPLAPVRSQSADPPGPKSRDESPPLCQQLSPSQGMYLQPPGGNRGNHGPAPTP